MKNKYFILCFFLVGCSGSFTKDAEAYFHNFRFIDLQSTPKKTEAQNEILQAKEISPEDYRIDSNLGVGFHGVEKPEEALKSFTEALQQIQKKYPQLNEEKIKAEFKLHFNKGVTLGSQKKIDEALASYQQALDLIPTSIEAKTNIELLTLTQQQDQKKKDDESKKSKENQQNKDQKSQDGQGSDKDKDKDKDQKDSEKEKDQEKSEKEKQAQDREKNQKYQPRPFKGDQLSEGDVKKILGELAQQDKKIRKQFDKKENKSEGRHDKDW